MTTVESALNRIERKAFAGADAMIEEIRAIRMDLQLERIQAGKTILVKLATDPGVNPIEVEAKPFGDHVAVFDARQIPGGHGWTVHHIPTGYSFRKRLNRGDAYALARLIVHEIGQDSELASTDSKVIAQHCRDHTVSGQDHDLVTAIREA